MERSVIRVGKLRRIGGRHACLGAAPAAGDKSPPPSRGWLGPADSPFCLAPIRRGRPYLPGPRYPIYGSRKASRRDRRESNWRNPRLAGSERLGPPESAEGESAASSSQPAAALHKTPASSAEVVAKLEPEWWRNPLLHGRLVPGQCGRRQRLDRTHRHVVAISEPDKLVPASPRAEGRRNRVTVASSKPLLPRSAIVARRVAMTSALHVAVAVAPTGSRPALRRLHADAIAITMGASFRARRRAPQPPPTPEPPTQAAAPPPPAPAPPAPTSPMRLVLRRSLPSRSQGATPGVEQPAPPSPRRQPPKRPDPTLPR